MYWWLNFNTSICAVQLHCGGDGPVGPDATKRAVHLQLGHGSCPPLCRPLPIITELALLRVVLWLTPFSRPAPLQIQAGFSMLAGNTTPFTGEMWRVIGTAADRECRMPTTACSGQMAKARKLSCACVKGAHV